jgi:hypothetical protein
MSSAKKRRQPLLMHNGTAAEGVDAPALHQDLSTLSQEQAIRHYDLDAVQQ